MKSMFEETSTIQNSIQLPNGPRMARTYTEERNFINCLKKHISSTLFETINSTRNTPDHFPYTHPKKKKEKKI